MNNEAAVRRMQVYQKKMEKISSKRMKREKLKHLLKVLGLFAERR